MAKKKRKKRKRSSSKRSSESSSSLVQKVSAGTEAASQARSSSGAGSPSTSQSSGQAGGITSGVVAGALQVQQPSEEEMQAVRAGVVLGSVAVDEDLTPVLPVESKGRSETVASDAAREDGAGAALAVSFGPKIVVDDEYRVLAETLEDKEQDFGSLAEGTAASKALAAQKDAAAQEKKAGPGGPAASDTTERLLKVEVQRRVVSDLDLKTLAEKRARDEGKWDSPGFHTGRTAKLDMDGVSLLPKQVTDAQGRSRWVHPSPFALSPDIETAPQKKLGIPASPKKAVPSVGDESVRPFPPPVKTVRDSQPPPPPPKDHGAVMAASGKTALPEPPPPEPKASVAEPPPPEPKVSVAEPPPPEPKASVAEPPPPEPKASVAEPPPEPKASVAERSGSKAVFESVTQPVLGRPMPVESSSEHGVVTSASGGADVFSGALESEVAPSSESNATRKDAKAALARRASGRRNPSSGFSALEKAFFDQDLEDESDEDTFEDLFGSEESKSPSLWNWIRGRPASGAAGRAPSKGAAGGNGASKKANGSGRKGSAGKKSGGLKKQRGAAGNKSKSKSKETQKSGSRSRKSKGR